MASYLWIAWDSSSSIGLQPSTVRRASELHGTLCWTRPDIRQFPGSRSKAMDLHLGTTRSIVAGYNYHEALLIIISPLLSTYFPSLMKHSSWSIYWPLSTMIHHLCTVLGHLLAIINCSCIHSCTTWQFFEEWVATCLYQICCIAQLGI